MSAAYSAALRGLLSVEQPIPNDAEKRLDRVFEADFLAFIVKEGADGERRKHKSYGLGEGDGSILAGCEVESLRKVRKNCAKHGGDHPVDEDGEGGGED